MGKFSSIGEKAHEYRLYGVKLWYYEAESQFRSIHTCTDELLTCAVHERVHGVRRRRRPLPALLPLRARPARAAVYTRTELYGTYLFRTYVANSWDTY